MTVHMFSIDGFCLYLLISQLVVGAREISRWAPSVGLHGHVVSPMISASTND